MNANAVVERPLPGLVSDLEQSDIAARINAWRDDYAQDPHVAIMAADDQTLAPFVRRSGLVNVASP